MRYTAQAAEQDITLYTSGIIENEQIRYIDYNDLMEDKHPVCGLGMVDNPGSCNPDEYDEDDGEYELTDWLFGDGDQSDIDGDSARAGCSHVRQAADSLGFGLLLGLMGLSRRRRSAS